MGAVELSLELAPVVDADDVRVRQPRGEVGFPVEPLPERTVGGEIGRQDLEGIVAGQPRMLGQVHPGILVQRPQRGWPDILGERRSPESQ